jgi:hypothetical protein
VTPDEARPIGAEVIVLISHRAIEQVADRIERAYRRRHPFWRRAGTDAGAWIAAARAMLALHRSEPAIPLDPELFVACQPDSAPLADPWHELTRPTALSRYRVRVRQIVRNLKRELDEEVRRAERRADRGEHLELILRSRSRQLSPIGRFILAHRAGRPELAEQFRAAAEDQHRSCPLYRDACHGLLPVGAYPGTDAPAGTPPPDQSNRAPRFSMN